MRTALLATALFAALAAPAVAQPAPGASPAPAATPKTLWRLPADGKWHVTVVPYLWAPNINGSADFTVPSARKSDKGRSVDVHVNIGPNNYLASLNFAAEVAGEVRHDDFSVYWDFINANASSQAGTIANISGPLGKVEVPVQVSIDTHLSTTIWQLAPSYTLAHGSDGTLDVLAGYRSANARPSADWSLAGPIDLIHPSGSVAASDTYGDFIAGVRGNVFLSDRWYVPYYGDAGWGNNNSTWQAYGGIGYAGRTTDVVLVYRNLQYNSTAGTLQILRLGGPALGVVFHW
ncbi:MAG TPA: hypothetical protein VMH02_09430 [Verrucomicrobiae bacterium]|nr:hypothetical protein [Verrucomicrobiae bacterium]